MSSPRYCDSIEPHAGHEWTHSYYSPDGSSFPMLDSHFFCWGVKPSPRFATLEDHRTRALAEAEHWRKALEEEAEIHRRSEDEFYLGDGCAPPCSSCGGETLWTDDHWVCSHCGDEWNEDHDPKYKEPS